MRVIIGILCLAALWAAWRMQKHSWSIETEMFRIHTPLGAHELPETLPYEGDVSVSGTCSYDFPNTLTVDGELTFGESQYRSMFTAVTGAFAESKIPEDWEE